MVSNCLPGPARRAARARFALGPVYGADRRAETEGDNSVVRATCLRTECGLGSSVLSGPPRWQSQAQGIRSSLCRAGTIAPWRPGSGSGSKRCPKDHAGGMQSDEPCSGCERVSTWPRLYAVLIPKPPGLVRPTFFLFVLFLCCRLRVKLRSSGLSPRMYISLIFQPCPWYVASWPLASPVFRDSFTKPYCNTLAHPLCSDGAP